MKLRQKIGKALNPDFLAYLVHRLRAVRRRSISIGQVLAAIDKNKFNSLKEKYFMPDEKVHPPKFLNQDIWLPKNLRRARECGITPALPKRNVLDIGCGVGWFLLVARAMGHDVRGLDLETDPIFCEMTALLGIPRTIHEIKAFAPLPEEIQGFDLVTAHMTCFNRYADGRHWGIGEWTFFLDDLRTRLNPKGVIYLELNPVREGLRIENDLKEWFRQQGAKVIFGRVSFKPWIGLSESIAIDPSMDSLSSTSLPLIG